MSETMGGNGKALLSGKVVFVGGGPGDPELITLKGWRALQVADVVLYDSLVNPRLLDDVQARRIYVGKRCGNHAMSQEEINHLLGDEAASGNMVVRLKGGDGAVLGRLGEEMLHLAGRSIPYEVVPGVTSATSVPAFAGIPVTHRGMADSFAVITAHRREEGGAFSIPAYNPGTTLVLLMSLQTTAQWQAQLLDQGYPPDVPVAFVSNGGMPGQRVLVTRLEVAMEDVAEAKLVSPTLAVVGRVAGLREQLAWYAGEAEAQAPVEPVNLPVPPLTGEPIIMGGD